MKGLSHCMGAALFAVAVLGSVRAQDSQIPPLVYDVENTGAGYAAPVFPSFEQLPIIRPLTDPFRFFSTGAGAPDRDTRFSSWERRRNEIKAAIEKYEIGPKPDCSDCTITATYAPPAAGAPANAKGTLSVVVTRNGNSLTLTSGVFLPTGMGSGPFPAMIAMTFFSSPNGANAGSLPAALITSRPIATVDFVHNQVTAYSFGAVDHSNDPFYRLYPELCAGTCNGTVSTSGQYAAWSWGVSRVIDGIEIASRQAVNPLPIDVRRVGATGCSYAGKMALFAGAFDERIALTIPQESGGGGAPAWRITRAIEAYGASEDIQRTNYDWFAGQMRQFSADNGYKLPTDHHELMGMVAPRALLATGNTDFYWLSNRSNYITSRATKRIYDTFGVGDRFGFYIDGGHGHCAVPASQAPSIAAFLDKFLLGDGTANTNVAVHPYPALDYARWTAWWDQGDTTYPRFPNQWNTDGTITMSLDEDAQLRIKTGETVVGGYQLAVRGANHPAATVSLVSGSVQADVLCYDGRSHTVTVPLPGSQALSIPAGDESLYPGRNPFQGSVVSTGCNGLLQGAYFTGLGISSGAGNAGGPGFTNSAAPSPLVTKFRLGVGGHSMATSETLTVNFGP
jgi:(4-O-methyl)-D-glucuronate---lignin esterase